jgi:PadR family transcriptional regulator PadR
MNKELMKGSTVILVLKVLSKQELYGYELIKELERRSQGAFELSEGTLYPILHALEKDKEIESYWVEEPNTRKRKYYRITKAGRKKLQEKRSEWEAFRSAVDQVLDAAKYNVESTGGA